jgi:hypothetical protein
MSAEAPVIGLFGLAVMGQNLALNIASKGFQIAVCNRSPSKVSLRAEEAASLRDWLHFQETLQRRRRAGAAASALALRHFDIVASPPHFPALVPPLESFHRAALNPAALRTRPPPSRAGR